LSAKDATIKKSTVAKMKPQIFNRQRNTFMSITETQSVLSKTSVALKHSQGFEKGKVRMQKRVNTLGPLEDSQKDDQEQNGLLFDSV
jgi:hypothetical protein